MKKFSIFSLCVLFSIFATSCEEDNLTTYSVNENPLEIQHLKLIPPTIITNNYTTATLPNTGRTEVEGRKVSYDFLDFEREIDFRAAIGQNNNTRTGYVQNWKTVLKDFFSLEDEINYTFTKYDALLEQAERQFAGRELSQKNEEEIDQQIDRLIEPYSSIISYSKEEGIERKTFSASVDYLLNRDGIVKIEDKIYQYKNDMIKMIADGDVRKISMLNNFSETDENLGIYVFPVQQVGNEGGRVEGFSSLSSCSNVNGGFKIIAYEEQALYYNYSLLKLVTVYQIKLRSLRKRRAWWGNRATKQHHSQGSYYANFNPAGTPTVSYSTPPLQNEAHTYIYTLASVEANARTPQEAQQMAQVISSNHSASGAHSTACTFGK